MRKTIIIASVILISILVILLLLNRPKLSPVNQPSFLTPTSVVVERNATNNQTINNALPLTPYENQDFSVDYSPSLNQLVVKEKTPQAKEKFNQWAIENSLPDLPGNPNLVVFENQSGENSNSSLATAVKPIIDFMNIFLSYGQGVGTTQPADNSENSKSSGSNSKNQSSDSNGQTLGLTYYAQCDSEYADLPLPEGNCNLCGAGCGPTTVAMIASSYLGNNFNPKTIVNMYKSRGYLLSCAGSSYYDAKSLLESLGLKTTDYITFNYSTADQAAGDLRKFINAGWTFFTLASFKDNGGGHYFWITDIDQQGNIWAYDPYYGRFEAPPLNENSRYPFPKYRIAFGVKK